MNVISTFLFNSFGSLRLDLRPGWTDLLYTKVFFFIYSELKSERFERRKCSSYIFHEDSSTLWIPFLRKFTIVCTLRNAGNSREYARATFYFPFFCLFKFLRKKIYKAYMRFFFFSTAVYLGNSMHTYIFKVNRPT